MYPVLFVLSLNGRGRGIGLGVFRKKYSTLAYGLEVNMLTRRDFFRFFLIGGILSLLRKKVKAEQKPKEAMFWRKID